MEASSPCIGLVSDRSLQMVVYFSLSARGSLLGDQLVAGLVGSLTVM